MKTVSLDLSNGASRPKRRGRQLTTNANMFRIFINRAELTDKPTIKDWQELATRKSKARPGPGQTRKGIAVQRCIRRRTQSGKGIDPGLPALSFTRASRRACNAGRLDDPPISAFSNRRGVQALSSQICGGARAFSRFRSRHHAV